jgi:hypothetical protein
MWPHVRPGSFLRAQPMLRALADMPAAANVLSRALAASAGMAPAAVAVAVAQQDAASDRAAVGAVA